MATENFNEAGEIFQNAIEIEELAKREQYIENACKGDPKLRAEVEALLSAHEKAGDYLEAPAVGSNVTIDGPAQIEGPGTRIGRYELLSLIGEGGMGLVYLAEQKELVKRRVALKIIKPGMDSRQVIARFEAERQALALLDHPNIAHVFDAGTTEAGRPYFVMEYVRGMSITAYCDQNRLNIEQRLRLFEQVCEAIHHAHQKGIIHRDIKPSNILVSVHGDRAVPKIIDFGIAKAITQPLTEKTFMTFQGQLLGTPEYMSPEQVDLAIQDIDTRSDIYSLGVVLYELLAGILPFEREWLAHLSFSEMQHTIREQEPASPSIRLTNLGEQAKTIAASRGTQLIALARRLHRELEWIPLKAMRKDRCRRYRSASEMADDIRNYLTGLPLIAGPETTVYRVKKFVHKHAGSVATVVLVAAAIVLGLIVSTMMYLRAEDARQKEATARAQAEQATKKEVVARAEAEQAKNAEQKQRKLAENWAEELRRTLYVNSIQLADDKYKEGNIGRVRELLDSCPNDLRGWEWNRLNYIHDESITTLRVYQEGIDYVAAFSPDGRRIITAGFDDKTIKMWDLATREVLKAFRGHENIIDSLAFSPDGRYIASGGDKGIIKLWDAQTGDEVTTLRGHRAWVKSLAFSSDGQRLVSCSTDMTIKVWDVKSGAEQMTLHGHRGWIGFVAFSVDGRRIASSAADNTIKVWDAITGIELLTIPFSDRNSAYPMAFSPDSKKIVSGGQDGIIKVWDAETGDVVMTIRGHNGPVESVVYSRDGKLIVSGGDDNVVKVWDAETGEAVRTFRGHDSAVQAVSFSPKGKHIMSASQDGTVKLWDVMIGRELRKVQGHNDWVWSLAFSPDGKAIVSSSLDSTIRLWNAQTGEPTMTIPIHRYLPKSASFSPDGKRILSAILRQGVVRVWDVSTGTLLLTLRGHKGAVWCAAFSPDGKYIISGSDDETIKLWNAESGADLRTLKGHTGRVWSVAFSPDGKYIVSGSTDGTAKLWNTATGSEILTFRGHEGQEEGVRPVVFSPDGKRVLSAAGTEIKIWDASTGADLITFHGHTNWVVSAAFSPDGKRIISGSVDGIAKLWDSATGDELLTFHVTSGIYSVAFSPDGTAIACGALDGSIVLWESIAPAVDYESLRNVEIARRLVEELYRKCRSYHDVISQLQGDVTIDPTVCKAALQITNTCKWKDADKLRKEAWATVRLPNKDVASYEIALKKASEANALEPNNSDVLITLGAAQYRLGSYEESLKTLTKAQKIQSATEEEPDPLNIAFTAMLMQQMGRVDEAKSGLERLRKLWKDESGDFADDTEALNLLPEAERLIAGAK
jgi:WD40 repeat protein/tRNA A-37 threonylcarbamoyl transferase component Bud32